MMDLRKIRRMWDQSRADGTPVEWVIVVPGDHASPFLDDMALIVTDRGLRLIGDDL